MRRVPRFSDWMQDPEFELRRPEYQGAECNELTVDVKAARLDTRTVA